MVEIEELDDGTFRALNDQGDELDNSPYDSKKGAKIALNKHKMKDEQPQDDENNELEDKEPQDDETKEEDNEENSRYNDVDPETEKNGLNPKPLMAGAAVLAVGFYFFTRSNDSQTVEEPEPETKEVEKEEDSRPSAGDMF